MAHRLVPQPDIKLLTPEQIVRCLRAEFDYVYADVGDADFYLAAMIDLCRKANDQEALQRYEAMIGKSIRIVVSDREFHEDDHIKFVAMPEEMPLSGTGMVFMNKLQPSFLSESARRFTIRLSLLKHVGEGKMSKDVVSTWLRATAAGDVDAILPLMVEDFVFLRPGQPPMRGCEAFAAGLRGALRT